MVLSGAQSDAYAQTQTPAAAPVRFDVISIKTIDPAVLAFRQPGTPPLAGMASNYTLRAGGTFRALAISARNLIATAFGVKPWQVVSDVDWLDAARFDITATTGTEVSRETLVVQAPALIQALLTDRFQLKVHREPRPFPVFALTVARQDQRLGPQLRRHDVDCDAQRKMTTFTPGTIPPPPSPTDRPTCGMNRWTNRWIGGSVSMQELANALTGVVDPDRVVVNRTNLDGRFDVDLTWSSEPLRAESTTSPGAAPANDDFTLPGALQQQLGLKLVPGQEPIDAVVVDHIERPSPN
jgi:uncharacterized protein (TIGR03435 family)